MQLIATYFLAAFFTFVAAFYTIRLTTQANAKQVLGTTGSSHWLGHSAFRLFRVLIWFACVARAFNTSVDMWLGVFQPLILAPVLLAGMLLMISGFALTVVGHTALGEQWISGIDPSGKSVLVTDGIYARSRNPVFIGVLLGQFGFALALPSVFSLVCLIVGVAAILNQIRLEERFLGRVLPQDYAVYCQQVPRWWGFFPATKALV